MRAPAGLKEVFADLVEHIDELRFQLTLLQAPEGEREPTVTARHITTARGELDQIDASATALKVPECGSASWGRAYVEAAEAFVAAQLPMPTPGTGDFATDATAACGRFYGTFASLPPNAEPPSDPAEYAAFLQMLEDAYEQLVVDLSALTPPAGSEGDYAEVVELVELAVESVDRADRDPNRLTELERPLGAIGAELRPRVRIVGFDC